MKRLVVVILSLFLFITGSGGSCPGQQGTDLGDIADLDEMTALANDFIQRRTSALVGCEELKPIPLLDRGVVRESAALREDEVKVVDELTGLREELRARGVAYVFGTSHLVLQAGRVEGGKVTLDFEERTKLYYLRTDPNTPEHTAWVSQRRFVFIRSGPCWELAAQELLNSRDPLPENEPRKK